MNSTFGAETVNRTRGMPLPEGGRHSLVTFKFGGLLESKGSSWIPQSYAGARQFSRKPEMVPLSTPTSTTYSERGNSRTTDSGSQTDGYVLSRHPEAPAQHSKARYVESEMRRTPMLFPETALEGLESDVSYSSDSDDSDDDTASQAPVQPSSSFTNEAVGTKFARLPSEHAFGKRRCEELPANLPKRLRPSPNPELLAKEDEAPHATDFKNDNTAIINTRALVRGAPLPVSFVCPYYLRSPSSHENCLLSDMWDIHAIKKHICVHHKRPPYCFVCGHIFPTHAACSAHMTAGSCQRTEAPPVVDGVDETQIEQLGRRSNRSLPQREQFRAVWNIVFPEIELPVAKLSFLTGSDDVQAAQERKGVGRGLKTGS